MNSKRIVFGIGMALVILAAFTAPAVADSVYFDPDPSTIGVGETATIQLMWQVDNNVGGDKARAFQVGIDFDPSVVNVTEAYNPCTVAFGGTCYQWQWPTFNAFRYYDNLTLAPMGGSLWTTGDLPTCCDSATVPIINLTVVGVSAGTGPLIITREIRAEPTVMMSKLTNCTPETVDNVTWVNGTVGCMGPIEIFKKDLVLGWNLISLPLTPVDNSTSAVLGNDTIAYDAVFRYDADATAKQFECPSTMDPGIGYFVNVTTAGTWEYTGMSYTSMNIELKQGLNCIGWVNTSADLPGAMSSISDNYRYVAGWDADDSKYEVYDANAPAGVPEFIDFTTMERGNGYWIAAKEDCTLNV